MLRNSQMRGNWNYTTESESIDFVYDWLFRWKLQYCHCMSLSMYKVSFRVQSKLHFHYAKWKAFFFHIVCFFLTFFDFQTQKKAVTFMATLFNNVEIAMNKSCMPETIGNCSCYLVCQVADIHIVSPSELNEPARMEGYKLFNVKPCNIRDKSRARSNFIRNESESGNVILHSGASQVQCSFRRPAILNYFPRDFPQRLQINSRTLS
jgi:hypothetical protein